MGLAGLPPRGAQPCRARRHRPLPELRHDRLAELRQVRLRRRRPHLTFRDLPPTGSKEIEDVFLEYFASQNLDTESIPFDSRSDYQSFFEEGIPAGGIISGDADKKTVEQAATYGGVPGLAYDPCYHQECDTLKDALQSAEVNQVEAAYGDAVIVGNVNTKALDEMSDAAAHATLTLAQTP